MLAASLQNLGPGDSVRQQLMQLQQPVQYLQHSGSHSSQLQQQQQAIQQSSSPHIMRSHTQMLPENLSRPILVNNQAEEQQQQHTYQEAFLIQSGQLQQRLPSNLPSPCFKTDFSDSNNKFPASIAPTSVQNMQGLLSCEGRGNLLNLSRTGQSMLAEQPPQQSWVPKFAHQHANTTSTMSLSPYSGKDVAVEQEISSLDGQNQTGYCANIDSSGLLLPNTISSICTSSVDASISSVPLGASGFQSSLYGYVEESSDFVKVYKSGSVGRSLDITRFSSYHELREELGRMFGIEGLLEDPQRSGWQLVFVDREDDVLLIGDDPWE
ncbi:unnamed protein product [Ilex paraguariensis]|uniref:PB1 domain-containing protein n=1 Tax=Ilex paraguariensis TaxID=185542 RepID=A0ABC8RGW4_9AQUA